MHTALTPACPRAHKSRTNHGRAKSACPVCGTEHIDQTRLLRELQTCTTSRQLPSYNDLARVQREHHALRGLVSRLVKSCLRYINFLHESAGRDTATPFKVECLCNRVTKHRENFIRRFTKFIRRIRWFDRQRTQLWMRALHAPDLTATKVAISALSPGSYQSLMRQYGLVA